MKCQAIRFMHGQLANGDSSLRDTVMQPTYDPLVGSRISGKTQIIKSFISVSWFSLVSEPLAKAEESRQTHGALPLHCTQSPLPKTASSIDMKGIDLRVRGRRGAREL